ncbi:MAG: hypothetical protein RBT80_28315 [Candidatus Vecturithrix sp.]|jgi:hypothetical protein|nr:hypothetical protein [Candidatus Vecturithrix sp.]
MNKFEPIELMWLPFEKETLLSILENLIYEDILATRQKLGKPAVKLLEVNFWTNIDLDFAKLLHASDMMAIVADFISHFWLPKERDWSLLTLPSTHASALKVLQHLAKEWNARWSEQGEIVFIGSVTPHIAQFLQEHREQIQQIIAFLGPNVQHVCHAWGFRPEQYKVVASRDTLQELDPTVRWSMIYGKAL